MRQYDGLVQKHAVVVSVEAQQREWQHLADLAEHGSQQRLLAHQHRRTLRPARRDVRHRQRLDEAAPGRRSDVCNQIRFHEAGRRIVPALEGSHRDASPERGRSSPRSSTASHRAHRRLIGGARAVPLPQPASASAVAAACRTPGPKLPKSPPGTHVPRRHRCDVQAEPRAACQRHRLVAAAPHASGAGPLAMLARPESVRARVDQPQHIGGLRPPPARHESPRSSVPSASPNDESVGEQIR